MANKERPDEQQAREIVEAVLGVTVERTDANGEADYGFPAPSGRRAAMEITTVTNPSNKIAQARWERESPRYRAARTLQQCWEVWLDDIDVTYRGLLERLEPALAILEATGSTFEHNRVHEFIDATVDERTAAQALLTEHVTQAYALPQLCAAEGPGHAHQINIVRTSGSSASGSDDALKLIELELNEKPDNGKKLRMSGADEFHLWVWLDGDTGLEIARPFRGGQVEQWVHFGLPSRAPSLTDPVHYLWIIDRATLTGWIWDSNGWRRHRTPTG